MLISMDFYDFSVTFIWTFILVRWCDVIMLRRAPGSVEIRLKKGLSF